MNMLLTLSHPNVVKCFGACVESKFLALVTDYWPRGCLYAVLHDPTVRMRCSHRFGSDAVGLRVHWRGTRSPTTVADADSGRRCTALACAQKCTPISLNRRIARISHWFGFGWSHNVSSECATWQIEIGWRLRLKLAIGAASGLRYSCDRKRGRMRAAHSFRFDLTDVCIVGFGSFLLRALRNAA